MKVFVLLAKKGFSVSVAYENGNMVASTKSDFAKNQAVVHELLKLGKALEIKHSDSPSIEIKSLGDLLQDADIPFKTYYLEVSADDIHYVISKTSSKNKLQYA